MSNYSEAKLKLKRAKNKAQELVNRVNAQGGKWNKDTLAEYASHQKAIDTAWNETLHPRDAEGKFT